MASSRPSSFDDFFEERLSPPLASSAPEPEAASATAVGADLFGQLMAAEPEPAVEVAVAKTIQQWSVEE
eukprot:COSAG01_NODE_5295_length_4352_cov_7.332236_6_plen_69_part_00